MSMAVTAVAAVAVGGASAYGAYATAEAAKENAKNVPQFNPVTLQPVGGNGVYDQFYAQQDELPAMTAFSQLLNQGYQQQLASVSPNIMANAQTLDQNARSQLQGLIPADVMAAAIRNSGYQAQQGGFGGGSDQGRGLTARNLGLTSLDLMNQGQSTLQNSMAMSSALNPTSPINWLFNPQYIQQRQDDNLYYNANLGQQNQMMKYQAESNANMVQAQNNPWVAGISAAGSTFMGAYGSMAGAGGAAGGASAGYTGFNGKTGFYGSEAAASAAYGRPANYWPGANGGFY